MIRKYAKFSNDHHGLHLLFVALTFAFFIGNIWFVFSTEEVGYFIALMLPLLPITLFAKSSTYRRQYLHN